MREILFEGTDCELALELNGRDLTWRFAGDKACCKCTLIDADAYYELRNDIIDEYNGVGDDALGYVNDFLQSYDILKYVDGEIYICFDHRTEDEIAEYMQEATDKVWLMRSCCIATKEPGHEVSIPAMERIFNTYDDIPEDGYSDWECGYWNGIMGALRWVLGAEKDFLDT